MALIGKWTKIEYIESETETTLQTITYPSELPEKDPDFDKAGSTEEVEVPKIDIIETVYEDVYVVVHSINSWKQNINKKTDTLFNICYRVYKSKQDRLSDYGSFIYEEHLNAQKIDYTLDKLEIHQAYDLVNIVRGYEELIND